MATQTIANRGFSTSEKVFYGNLLIMLFSIIVFSFLYLALFDVPTIEEYKNLSKEGAKVYFGIIPIISYGLYRTFKNNTENK